MRTLQELDAALEAARVAAELSQGPPAPSVAVVATPAGSLPWQTVTVTRGKRSRRTPLAKFQGLLQARGAPGAGAAPRNASARRSEWR